MNALLDNSYASMFGVVAAMPPLSQIVTSAEFIFGAALFAVYIVLSLEMIRSARRARDGDFDPESEKEDFEQAMDAEKRQGADPGEMTGVQLYWMVRAAGAEAYQNDGWRGVAKYMAVGFVGYLAIYGSLYALFFVLLP